ncbi:PREDICTED: putative ribonuclease H protein At1g65750-like [Fragaria vesca subsp. vesca]
MRVFRSIKAWLQFLAPHAPGDCSGILDAQLLVKMGVTPSRAQKRIRLVLWHPPLSPWIKLNTDGLAKGNPGPATCGGVFRDYQGHFIGGFSTPIGHHNDFFSELLAVIIGIELAFQLGWQHVWLECDSTSVVECFSKSSFVPPWQLRTLWYNCVARTRSMSFFCSHVLREGNIVADRLVNLGMSSSSWIWHASPPAEIIHFLRMDFLGFPYIRHG